MDSEGEAAEKHAWTRFSWRDPIKQSGDIGAQRDTWDLSVFLFTGNIENVFCRWE